jgi:hypothetical protein
VDDNAALVCDNVRMTQLNTFTNKEVLDLKLVTIEIDESDFNRLSAEDQEYLVSEDLQSLPILRLSERRYNVSLDGDDLLDLYGLCEQYEIQAHCIFRPEQAEQIRKELVDSCLTYCDGRFRELGQTRMEVYYDIINAETIQRLAEIARDQLRYGIDDLALEMSSALGFPDNQETPDSVYVLLEHFTFRKPTDRVE